MPRPSVLPLLIVLCSLLGAIQAPSVLHIRVMLVHADQKVTPVARYTLLISDNPATAPPREVVTAADGTADVKLPPGNYTIESDAPFVFEGRAYTWTQTLDVPAGRDATLELTAANAEVAAVAAVPAAATPVGAPNTVGANILARWQDSVVELWTPTVHASGFVVSASGWVATNQRVVAGTTSVEVQLTPALKVAGTVVAAEPGRDVAIIRIDPGDRASVASVALPCASPSPPKQGQPVFAIGAPLRQPKSVSAGTVGRVGPHALETDIDLEPGSVGGPAFTADGTVLGVTSVVDGSDERRPDYRVVRVTDVCAVIASAEKLAKGAAPPGAAHLPVEPMRPFPRSALEDVANRHAGSRNPYQASSSDFDVALITPPLIYGARHQTRPTSLPERTTRTRVPDPEAERRAEALMDFGRWSDYVADDPPPVLFVRVTPRLVEGFWRMVARGAAQTQGMSLPPMKHFKAGFARMQAFCGDTQMTPIHPFVLERAISQTDTIDEGLYVFDPSALTPDCGSVRLVLYSQQSPEKGETLVVDGKLLLQVWQDFAPYREQR